MAVVKLKDPEGAKVRTIESKSTNGIKCEIKVSDGHSFVTDEPEERGELIQLPLLLCISQHHLPHAKPCKYIKWLRPCG